jgi:hypothetical protein
VCTSPKRAEIDKALVAGQPYRTIAQQFATSPWAVLRHKATHLRGMLAQAERRQEQDDRQHGDRLGRQVQEQEHKSMEQALDVVKQLRAINAAALTILDQARQAGNGELVLKAVDRVQRQIELQAKLLGELSDAPTINVLMLPEWLTLRTAILDALMPYGEARIAVAQRLRDLEAAGGGNGHR